MRTPVRVLMMVPDHQMIDRRVLQQARTLVQAGYAVRLLAGFDCAEDRSYEEHGVQVHRYRYDWSFDPLSKLPFRVRGGRVVRALVRRLVFWATTGKLRAVPFDQFVIAKGEAFDFDVVHVHDLPLLAAGAELAKRRNVPLVFDSHEIYYEQDSLLLPDRLRLKATERRYFRDVVLPITVNDAIADYFAELHGKRPLVLLNAAETPAPEDPAIARHRLREKAGLGVDVPVVLFQGWISSERNLMNLVLAAELLSGNAVLVLIGYGAYEAELRKAIEGKPWGERVRFLGKIESADLAALTAGADVGVIPYLPIDLNHRLCSPNKFFEFVQSGVPIVAHDLPFFRGMGEKYGVVRTGNFESACGIAATVNAILDDVELARSMAENCREAAKVLNWETEGAKLVQAYSPLAFDARKGASRLGTHGQLHEA